MTATPGPADGQEQIARIERMNAETRKFVEEGLKLAAEARKLSAETRKFGREAALLPFTAGAAVTGAVVAATLAVQKLLWGA